LNRQLTLLDAFVLGVELANNWRRSRRGWMRARRSWVCSAARTVVSHHWAVSLPLAFFGDFFAGLGHARGAGRSY
jgi:hypothetical protein